MFEYVLRSRRVVRPEGVGPAAILVRGGRIADVFPEGGDTPSPLLPSDIPVTDVGDSVVMPGLVDIHVRVGEPGPGDGKGFGRATRAAAAGGVTTLIDLASDGLPTTNRGAFDRKGESAAGRLRVDVGFWGALVPGNLAELSPLRAAGVFGYECYLRASGMPEFSEVTDHDLLLATERLGETPLLAHAPDKEAVSRIIRISRLSRTPVHVLHSSSADVLETIRRAKADEVRVTAEVSSRDLAFAPEEIPGGAARSGSPPIEHRQTRERLWEGLSDGTIDVVVSGDRDTTPGSVGLTLAATWSAASARGFGLDDLSRWLSEAPAKVAGLFPWKGTIAAGRNADFVVWNPEWKSTAVSTPTPWPGETPVEATYLKGRKIYERGQLLSSPRGEILLSGE